MIPESLEEILVLSEFFSSIHFQTEMFVQTTDISDRQRPYKIFVSLLDKWEIGYPLTEVLVLDSFQALKLSFASDTTPDEV